MMQYRIITADLSSELDAAIEAYIELGWKPVGGVSVVARQGFATGLLFAQAITREPICG